MSKDKPLLFFWKTFRANSCWTKNSKGQFGTRILLVRALCTQKLCQEHGVTYYSDKMVVNVFGLEPSHWGKCGWFTRGFSNWAFLGYVSWDDPRNDAPLKTALEIKVWEGKSSARPSQSPLVLLLTLAKRRKPDLFQPSQKRTFLGSETFAPFKWGGIGGTTRHDPPLPRLMPHNTGNTCKGLAFNVHDWGKAPPLFTRTAKIGHQKLQTILEISLIEVVVW